MTSDGNDGGDRIAEKPVRPRDRRATHRAGIEIPAVIQLGMREVACSVRDLSTRGISLVVKESLAPGMVVRAVFRLPNARRPVEVTGVLVRQAGGRDKTTVGLQFVEPDADSVRIIRTFVGRNRSDRPFSRGGGRDTARIEAGKSAASLQGLYEKAVDDVGEKGRKRRGFLARWLHRGGS